jgi:membrane-bound serine protease (ClpP class)
MGTIVVMMIGLIVAAMVLFALEIIMPSFAVPATGAIVALGAALYLAYTLSPMLALAMGMAMAVAVPAYLFAMVKWLPKTALGRHLFLAQAPEATGEAVPEAIRQPSLVGETAVVESALRPSGTIRLGEQCLTAQSEHGMIAKGTSVRVVRVDGSSIFVRPVSPLPGPAAGASKK